MLQYIYSLFTTGIFRKIWLKLIILLSIIIIIIFLIKKHYKPINEGFSQKEHFISKYNENIYDDFYVEMYDKINKPIWRTLHEINSIVQITQPDKSSIFLDIGSGTGHIVNELTELGYNTYGVDKSQAMIEYSTKKFPDIMVKNGDVMDTMLYDKSVFSHVLCLYFTIYQFKDKSLFFRNCYFWLKPGGYLILHLVDRKTYDIHVPAAKHFLFGSPQRFRESRDTDSIVEFDNFKYKLSYQFNYDKNETTVKETFTDSINGNVRQNENILYMEDINDIIQIASRNGFIVHGKIDLKESSMDKNQFFYFLERAL
jgi:ubiquinone/menaquinone biosynthesis C-methylase UbiE